MLLLRLLTAVCLVLALARLRWAYAGFVALALLSFPARLGFVGTPRACEGLVSLGLALYSFRNLPHILLFAGFFLLTRRQLVGQRAGAWAAAGTLVMGALVELAEGASGAGHCRLRDMLPDAAGAALGWVLLLAAHAAWSARPRSRRSESAA